MTVQPENLFEALLGIRDRFRTQQAKGAWVVRGDETPWEQNRHGEMKWMLHPALESVALRTLIVFEQRIPPGGRTGRQQHPGGQAIFVKSGEGYTIMDGVRIPWKADDVITLPLRENGVIFQHFNSSKDQPALLVCCQPNFTDSLGLDQGSAFEQLESAPAPTSP